MTRQTCSTEEINVRKVGREFCTMDTGYYYDTTFCNSSTMLLLYV